MEGNPNDPDNLVYLTTKEHYHCHWLLMQFYDGLALKKMKYAFIAMNFFVDLQKRKRNYDPEGYTLARKLSTEMTSARFKHKPKTPEQTRKMVETRQKNGSYKPWNKGIKSGQKSWNEGLTAETSEKLKSVGVNISKALKGKPSKTKGIIYPEKRGINNPSSQQITIGINKFGSLSECARKTNLPWNIIRNLYKGIYPHKAKYLDIINYLNTQTVS